MPPVPYTNETLAQLQQRYHEALEFVYDQAAIVNGAIRPGECAANVFDFEDGLRLLVSRERAEDGRVSLHLSASFRANSKIGRELMAKARLCRDVNLLANEWAATVPARFQELSQDSRSLTFVEWSEKMVPHWMRDEVEQSEGRSC